MESPHGPRRGLVTLVALALVPVLVLIAVTVWFLVGRAQPHPWSEVEFDGREVVVDYVGGECDRSARLEVEETSDEVVLTVWVSDWSLSCSDVGVPRTVRGTLQRDVGERTVRDGACADPGRATWLDCAEEPVRDE